MASPVKVSKYRSGVPRFGRVDIDWNPADTLKTYKLTPDELEQYKAGKSVYEILMDREGGKMAFEMPIEEFVDLHKDEVEKALKEAELKCRKVSESKTTQTEIKDGNELNKKEIIVLENELREEYENEIEKLKREVIDAHKLVTEWQEKYEKLREQFSDALQVKDIAIKENAELENERLKLERENKKLTEELAALKKEKAILVEFSYQKLSKAGESA